MKSKVRVIGNIDIPLMEGEVAMIPFNAETFEGLPEKYLTLAKQMLSNLRMTGTAFFTIHGKILRKGETLRRGAPHTDGNYEPVKMDFGGGWKVGENGPPVGSDLHARQYLSEKGGILLASNHKASLGWAGEYDATPMVGGDCRHIDLGEPFGLDAGKVYYGNNHFIHESLPMDVDVHRVMVRITLPEFHEYIEGPVH